MFGIDLVDIPQAVVLARKAPFCITSYIRSRCVGALSPEACKINITFNNAMWLQYQHRNTFLHLGVGFGPMGYMGGLIYHTTGLALAPSGSCSSQVKYMTLYQSGPITTNTECSGVPRSTGTTWWMYPMYLTGPC